mmetsp:Transcript_28365/g.91560  ORF Transcript_28365/g.91560 Transcript_28365/m.91560 type:complete len:111 (-) Transcript_28365:24-356(-)
MASCGAPPATGCGALHLLSAAPSRAQSSATGARHPFVPKATVSPLVEALDVFPFVEAQTDRSAAFSRRIASAEAMDTDTAKVASAAAAPRLPSMPASPSTPPQPSATPPS